MAASPKNPWSIVKDQKYSVCVCINNTYKRIQLNHRIYLCEYKGISFILHHPINRDESFSDSEWITSEVRTGASIYITPQSTRNNAYAIACNCIDSMTIERFNAAIENTLKEQNGVGKTQIKPQAAATKEEVFTADPCSSCDRNVCALRNNGMADLCKGKKAISKAATPAPSPSPPEQVKAPEAKKPKCYLEQVKSCQVCKLVGMEDLCKFKPVRITDRALTTAKKPARLKGAMPDFWIKSTTHGTLLSRDNSKFLGNYVPESVIDAISEGIRVSTWEYRAYKEDPETPRRIYAGDDRMIRESALDHYKGGGYTEDDDSQPALVTPYDEGLDPEEDMIDPENADMWHGGGFVPAFIFRQTHRDRKVLVVPDGKDRPYYRWETVPTLKPVGCKVEIRDGYVVPAGKHVKFSTVKTHADKKRARDRGEISRQKRAYYGYIIKKDAVEHRTGQPLTIKQKSISNNSQGFQREPHRIEPFVGRGQKEMIRKVQRAAPATS